MKHRNLKAHWDSKQCTFLKVQMWLLQKDFHTWNHKIACVTFQDNEISPVCKSCMLLTSIELFLVLVNWPKKKGRSSWQKSEVKKKRQEKEHCSFFIDSCKGFSLILQEPNIMSVFCYGNMWPIDFNFC